MLRQGPALIIRLAGVALRSRPFAEPEAGKKGPGGLPVQVDKALAAGTRPRFAAGPPGHEDGLCDTPGKMQPGGLSIWRDIPEGDAAENLADGPDGARRRSACVLPAG